MENEKKDWGPFFFSAVGLLLVGLLLLQCVERASNPPPTYDEIKARAERQVELEEKIARIEGEPIEREIADPDYRP